MERNFFIITFVVAAVMAGSVCAASAQVFPYLGIGAGINNFDTNLHPLSGATLDDSDSGTRLFGGIRFNDIVAVEVAKVDFGEGSLRGKTGDSFTLDSNAYVFLSDGELKEEVNTWAYGLVLNLPLNRLNGKSGREIFLPFVRFGFNSWSLDQRASFSGFNATFSDSGTNPWFGFGCEVDMTEHLGMRLGYDWYIINDDDNVIDRISSLGLDLMFRF